MHVSEFGPSDGPPVLLLHGGGVAGWMWNSLRKSLESRYTVLGPDLPGHGQSADKPYRSHTETVDALSQVLVRRALMRDSVVDVHTALPGSEIEIIDGRGHGIPLECQTGSTVALPIGSHCGTA
ncbi:alpha/beta fold hydrolase [Cryobacterium serini]|uniref:Alpha/beta fold hydrolase n=1 Tax=Cryobacterium serini TaxID=1259201 RepID=A0A4R9BQA5_9MICO|nr:alpha/beta fold hydrolase [Cryobacterium serini]TFD87849.1 alpha/beta fold hydrolase [Cryobacterium serini]